MNHLRDYFSEARLNELWIDGHPLELEQSRSFDVRLYGGATSNPSILANHYASSGEYRAGMSREQFDADYFAGMGRLFGPLHRSSGGKQGWVSWQVPPHTMGSCDEMLRDALSKAATSPNIMAKVPGNGPGLPVVQELVRRGLSVNGTMNFTVAQIAAFGRAVRAGEQDRDNLTAPSGRIVVTHMIGRVGDSVHPYVLEKIDPYDLRILEVAIARRAVRKLESITDTVELLISSVRIDNGYDSPHLSGFCDMRTIFTLKPSTISLLQAQPEGRGSTAATTDSNHLVAHFDRCVQLGIQRPWRSVPWTMLSEFLDEDAHLAAGFEDIPAFRQVHAELAQHDRMRDLIGDHAAGMTSR